MTNKLPQDSQMTDVFGRFQNSPPAEGETSGPRISNRKKSMFSTAAVLLGGAAAFAAIDIDEILAYVDGNEDTAPAGEESITSENEAALEPTATPVRHHTASAVQNGTITPNENIAIAGQVREQMPFGEAYAAAREEVGPGGVFSWHGQVYNTYTREEWQGLSLSQRQEFLSDVGYQPTQGTPPIDNGNDRTGPREIEPAYVELVINGRPALGIDDDHDGIANAIMFMDEDTENILAFVDAEGDNRIDTVILFDAASQAIVGQQAIEEPFMAEISELQALSAEVYQPAEPITLVADSEEMFAYDDDNDYTDDNGYVNDAELPEMD